MEYKLYGVRRDSDAFTEIEIDNSKDLSYLVSTGEYILLKAKRFTHCKIKVLYNKISKEEIIWETTTEKLTKGEYIMPPNDIYKEMMKEVN